MFKALLAGMAVLLFGPAACVLAVAVVMNPSAQASCLSPEVAPAAAATQPGETSRIVFPLPEGIWIRTSGFGPRTDPLTEEASVHRGVDFAAPAGTPIFALADGMVTYAGPATGYGNLLLIEHTVDGQLVASGYAHMPLGGTRVEAGDTVSAGQHVAVVGSAGNSTGPHLHLEIRPGGADAAPVDPESWLTAQGPANQGSTPSVAGAGCVREVAEAAPYPGDDPDRLVDDPTTSGMITARTAHVLAQLRARFPGSAWSCWAPRPGTESEHPKGRACDGTFGNSIGTAATGDALALGWEVANWLKANAETLGIEYLIWQSKIWSVARDREGWRPYDGGGMHDVSGVTGSHRDHLHLTNRSGP